MGRLARCNNLTLPVEFQQVLMRAAMTLAMNQSEDRLWLRVVGPVMEIGGSDECESTMVDDCKDLKRI